MKVFGFLLALGFVAGAFTTAEAATDATRTICHRTASAKNPVRQASGLGRQVGRPSQACRRHRSRSKRRLSALAADRCLGRTCFHDRSDGRSRKPCRRSRCDRHRHDQATRRARPALLPGSRQEPPPAVAMHIHKGAARSFRPSRGATTHTEQRWNCHRLRARARPLVTAMLAAPASYYLNIHTAEFAAGAIRGQLTGTSAESFGWIVAVDLKGTSEPNATGTAVVRIPKDSGMVCYRLHVRTSPFRQPRPTFIAAPPRRMGRSWSRSPHPAPTGTRADASPRRRKP